MERAGFEKNEELSEILGATDMMLRSKGYQLAFVAVAKPDGEPTETGQRVVLSCSWSPTLLSEARRAILTNNPKGLGDIKEFVEAVGSGVVSLADGSATSQATAAVA